MYNVLLVEDEAYTMELLLETFNWKSLGLIVSDTALNGYQGYNKFIVGNFDIVIADIKMPIMTGIEMAQKIRMIDERVKIVFISSYEEFEYAKKAIEIDVTGYCLKPLNDNELAKILGKAIAKLSNNNNSVLPTTTEPEKMSGKLLIQEIKNYIDLNISKKIGLKDLSEHFMYSPNHLGLIFKKETGMSLNEYVNKAKLDKAAKLLRISHNKITDVAYQLGYIDVAYFAKQFKKHFKTTPTSYRNRFSGDID